MSPALDRPLRVLHFVTGGFSGATQVAVDLAAAPGAGQQALLVLRRKRTTTPDKLQALRARGLQVECVPGWSHLATIVALRALCRRWQADVLVAHGYSEHLWGRLAGLWAGVPTLLQVEHSSRERYSPLRLALSRWLARRSACIVGVSEGVCDSLRAQGLPAARLQAIPNGIRIERFAEAPAHPWAARRPGLVMAARFAAQKDHATLLRALALLRDRHGLRPPLLLAGGGSAKHLQRAQALCRSLQLEDQVQFAGHVADLPQRLMQHQIAVLSSHHEGMPLSLIEGMAAGCVAVGSDVPGIHGVLRDGDNGRLVPAADPDALAQALADCLTDPALSQALAERGRREAADRYTLGHMANAYARLFDELARPTGEAPA